MERRAIFRIYIAFMDFNPLFLFHEQALAVWQGYKRAL
jgi:hypothetical protein